MPGNITIQKVLSILLHRIVFILATGAVMGMLFFLYTSIIITPRYSTSAMIFIQNYDKAKAKTSSGENIPINSSNNQDEGNQGVNSSNNQQAKKIFSSDISGSSSLAKICVTLFQNSDEVTALYNGCNVGMTVNENTFYVTISVDGNDPQKCATVANQISEKCIDVYAKYFDYGQIGIIRTAKEPGAPYSPNKMQNTLIGVAVGLAIACIIAVMLELIDTTIKSDEDLSEIYKIPVFAEIPDFDS